MSSLAFPVVLRVSNAPLFCLSIVNASCYTVLFSAEFFSAKNQPSYSRNFYARYMSAVSHLQTRLTPQVYAHLPLALLPLALLHENPSIHRSTVEGATLGLGKILGACWTLTYVALVLGKPRFQRMLDPSLLLPVEDTGSGAATPALTLSGGGSSGREIRSGAGESPCNGVVVVSDVAGGRSGKPGGPRQRASRLAWAVTPQLSRPAPL